MADDGSAADGRSGRGSPGDSRRDSWRRPWSAIWRGFGDRHAARPRDLDPKTVRQPDQIKAVIAALPVPAIVIRGDRIHVFNGAAAAVVSGLRRGEPAAIALRTPELIGAIRRAAATGRQQRTEFFQPVPHDRWFEVFVSPLESGEAASQHLVTFNDLTPLRRVEEMRVDFVANASHELRTPLAALLGFIETLQGPARDDAAARERFLAIMRNQAARMARLIDDLLSLSRIELNAHLRPQTPIELGAVVRQVIDGLQMLAQDRDVQLNVTLPSEPVTVAGDHDELIRALENLVENALKYGATGKRVDVGLSQHDTDVQISVRDYGPGIAPEHMPRLTERFYRVDIADSRSQGGTGLGLALVKHILNRHGGRLGIESVSGAGATFRAHLPVFTGETPAG